MMKQIGLICVGLLLSFLAYSAEIKLPVVTQQRVVQSDFDQPTAIATSLDGRLFVLDGMKSRVVVFSNSGTQIVEISPNDKIPDFSKAVGLTWANGLLYIADTMNHRILVLTDKGELNRIINLPKTEKEPLWPAPVAVSVSHEVLAYSDRRHHRLCLIRLDAEKKPVAEQTCVGERGEQAGYFQFPFQIAVDRDDYLHVVDVINGRVQVFNLQGQYFSQEGEFAVDVLYRPNGIAIDSEGYQYVSDAYLGTIAVFEKGNYVGVLKDMQGKVVKFTTPVSLWINANTLSIVDATTNKVHQLQIGYTTQADVKLTRQSPDLSRKNCVACHFSWGFSDERKLEDKQGVQPVSALNMCYSCHHGVVFESRQAIPHGGQHPTVYDADDEKAKRQKGLPREDDLPEELPLLDDGEMLCTSCHTPHNPAEEQPTLYVENTNSWMRVVNKDSDLCESCHESNVETARERDKELRGANHPLGFKMSKPPRGDKSGNFSKDPHLHKGLPKSFLAGGAVLGKNEEMVCQSCHQVHGGEGDNLVPVTDDEGKMCGECHKRQSPQGEENTSDSYKEAARKAGVHPINTKLEKPIKLRGKKVKKVICQSCHQVHDGTVGTPLYPDEITETKVLCAGCHARQSPKGKGANPSSDSNKKAARKAGVHPVNIVMEEAVKFRGKKTKIVDCASCHSVHKGTKDTPLFPDKIKKAEKLCVACHERHHAKDLEDAKKKGVHVMNEELEESVKIGQGDKEIEVKQMGCLSCHSMHQGKKDTPALIVDHKNGALCENCHEGKQRVVGTDHDFRVTAKKSQNEQEEKPHQSGACGTCHTMHRGKEGQPYLNAAVVLPKKERDDTAPKLAVDELCMNCHQDSDKSIGKEKPIVHYGHPYKDMILRSDPETFPLLKEGSEEVEEIGVMACITCHEPHTWKPRRKHASKAYDVLNYKKQENIEGNALDSFLRVKGVQKTFCVDCHNIEALSKFKYFHHKDKVRDIGVDYLH